MHPRGCSHIGKHELVGSHFCCSLKRVASCSWVIAAASMRYPCPIEGMCRTTALGQPAAIPVVQRALGCSVEISEAFLLLQLSMARILASDRVSEETRWHGSNAALDIMKVSFATHARCISNFHPGCRLQMVEFTVEQASRKLLRHQDEERPSTCAQWPCMFSQFLTIPLLNILVAGTS